MRGLRGAGGRPGCPSEHPIQVRSGGILARLGRTWIAAAALVLAAGVLCLLAGAPAGAQGAGGSEGGGRGGTEPSPVIVAEARIETIADRIEALGTTHASESVEITSDVTEKVVEIRFEDGQAVEAGDALVVLDQAEEKADLHAAEAVLEEARLAYARYESLERQQVAAIAELDSRRAALQSAEAELAVIRSRIEARLIRAPFAGVVGFRRVSLGALVRPGDVVTTLDTLDPMRVDFTVPSEHLEALRPGLAVTARASALAGRAFEGEIASVGTRVDPVTRSIPVRAGIPNPGPPHALKPGLLMTVELAANPREAVIVPEEAIVPEGSRAHVLVVDAEGRVERRAVATGLRRPGNVEIREGLDAGERVVTHGVARARPGQRVRVRAVQRPGTPLAELLAAEPAEPTEPGS